MIPKKPICYRRFVDFDICAPERIIPRQTTPQFVDTTKEEIMPKYKPLTKEQLRPLWNTILDYISQLPADSLENMYGL